MAQQETMNLLKFRDKFTDENACVNICFKYDGQKGFTAPNVGTNISITLILENSMNVRLVGTKHR